MFTQNIKFNDKLLIYSFFIIFLSTVINSLVMYQHSKKELEERVAAQIKDVVAATAPLIDASLHEDIFYMEGELYGANAFDSLRKQLVQVYQGTGLKSFRNGSPLYTLRKAEDFYKSGNLEFVVMTHANEKGNFFTGYKLKAEPHHIRAFEDGDVVATSLYEDAHGQWLSAIAPIRDKNGEVVAILQGDRTVNFYQDKTKSLLSGFSISSALTIFLVLFLAMFFSRRLIRPIYKIIDVTKEIGHGNSEISIERDRFDELGDLQEAIGRMAAEIKAKKKELLVHQNNLEQLVDERTAELHQANDSLVSQQEMLVQQEKMASLGVMAAGVAHEINNPLGFVTGNIDVLSDYTQIFKVLYEKIQLFLESEDEETKATLLKEIKDHIAKEDIEFITDDLDSIMPSTLDGLTRVREIVVNLREYSRVDSTTDIEDTDINLCIESTLCMVNNELKYHCDIVKELGDIPLIKVHTGKINQVLTNLFVNAGHAIEKSGKIIVSTYSKDEFVCIKVEDNGKGMPQEVIDKVFDPFFTTKAVGEGTGLGLSLSKGIVDEHNGKIEVESKPGVGTTFIISLPLQQPIE